MERHFRRFNGTMDNVVGQPLLPWQRNLGKFGLFLTKSPISRFVWQIDRICLGLPGGSRGWPIQRNHANCYGADPCCNGNKIWARHGDPVAYRLVSCFCVVLFRRSTTVADMWLMVISTLVMMVAPCSGHVGLYYPPARTYALDFLDSARTQPPCGMARGHHVFHPFYLLKFSSV